MWAVRIRIDVTADDIAKGKPKDWCRCPVSLALRRVLPQSSARVPADGLEVFGRQMERRPPGVARFVRDFDKGRPVAPFSFVIDTQRTTYS